MIWIGIVIGIVATFTFAFIAGFAFVTIHDRTDKAAECREELFATLTDIEWKLYKLSHPEIYDQD